MKRLLSYIGVVALCITTPVWAAEADYLDAELREKVEALKAAYRESATTPASYSERAAVAWEWINAYARTGAFLPVNITTAVRPVLPRPATPNNARGLDYYIREMILLDETPEAIGDLDADLGPYEARTFVTLRQRYTVGAKAIEPGGGFLIAGHFQPRYGRYQVESPEADNYVTISSTNPEVSFLPDARPLSGMHGGFRGAQPVLFFTVDGGTLEPGDVVTITYGDTASGSRGWRMGFPSTDFLPVPLYVDFDGSGHSYALPIQPVRVSGTEIAGVHGFAPSVVRPGESFDLSVRAEDRFYNRAKGPIPGFNVFANGAPLAAVPASDEPITVVSDLSFDTPGVYRITIVSANGSIRGVGNPILVDADATKLFWGDTHGHSGFAEGIGTPDRFMQWAKDDARLDFVTHSEHDIWMDDYEWGILKASVEKYSEPGRFIGYLGYEWTANGRFGGHHNVLYRNVDDRSRVPTQIYPTLSKLYAGLRNQYSTDDVLVIPHAHQSGDFRQSDPELQNLIEIMSQHGTFEWFGQRYADHGHQVGFVAASDNHLSQPGYTSVGGFAQRGGLAAVRTNDGSRDGIFDAMKASSAYATTGDKIILDVRMNGAEMGTRAPYAEERRIVGRVVGTGPLDTVTIVKNGRDVWQQQYLEAKSGRYDEQETLYVTFESDSHPMHPQDNARGGRGWQGTLEITGADIVTFEATDFFNPETTRLARDADNPNLLHFMTRSRGDASSIKLTLQDINRNAKVVVDLESVRERGSPTFFRPPALSPATQVTLEFRDLDQGRNRQTVPMDIYQDSVTLRRVIETGVDDATFTFTDAEGLQGDYYYVRVKQANDAMAWSSPIWVGGIPPL
jgi:hypothetical protein